MIRLLSRITLPCTVVALLLAVAPASACPFCGPQGEDATVRNETKQAKLVIYGQLTNPKYNGFEKGTTDLIIEKVLKPHPILGKARKITLDRYFDLTKEIQDQKRFLIFCDVFKGKLDPYRGVGVEKGSDVVEYVQGVMASTDKPISERLKFYFKYLDNDELLISNDAYNEFAFADYKDYKDMAKDLPADRIYGWLSKDPAPYRYGLYASMLGHCSKDKSRDVELLQSLVDDRDKGVTSGLDGILASIVMIEPKQGWNYVQGILGNSGKPFTRRYAALRAARFLYDFRPDIIKTDELLKGVSLLLDQEDIADLAIEDLRKRKAWDRTEKILALFKKESHDIAVIRRSIVRFALSSPKSEAKKFIAEQRERDRELVEDVEELLKLER